MIKNKIAIFFRLAIPALTALFLLLILMRYHSFLVLCCGICIFLFAMSILQESFKILSGGILDSFLDKVANTNLKSFFFGFTLSTLVQSSGLVSVVAISFLSAGLISLSSGVAMIYGVNLSTALSAWIMSFFGVKSQISLYAMPLIVFGVLLFLSKEKKVKGFGLFLLAIGFLFLGISYMKEGFENFKDSVDISRFRMQGFLGLIVYVGVGFFITCLTQSSHATLTLALTALSVEQISYENAIAVTIGANIGSTITSVIGSLNANIEGKKLTVTHVLFNMICAVLSIVLFKYYLLATDFFAEIFKISEDDFVLKLSLFTTIFNVIGVILFYPFISWMCHFLNRFVKEDPKKFANDKPLYLTQSALEFTGSSLEVLYLESKHLFNNASSIIAQMISLKPSDIYSKEEADQVINLRNTPIEVDANELYQRSFKGIYSDIIDFAVRASSLNENSKQSSEFMDIRRANLFMATAVKDAVDLQVNVLKYGFNKNEDIKNEYNHLRRNLLRALRLTQKLIVAKDEEVDQITEELESNIKKYDAISSNSLDSLIRYKRITDTQATSIMNDTALSRDIAKDLIHASKLIISYKNKEFSKSYKEENLNQ